MYALLYDRLNLISRLYLCVSIVWDCHLPCPFISGIPWLRNMVILLISMIGTNHSKQFFKPIQKGNNANWSPHSRRKARLLMMPRAVKHLCSILYVSFLIIVIAIIMFAYIWIVFQTSMHLCSASQGTCSHSSNICCISSNSWVKILTDPSILTYSLFRHCNKEK